MCFLLFGVRQDVGGERTPSGLSHSTHKVHTKKTKSEGTDSFVRYLPRITQAMQLQTNSRTISRACLKPWSCVARAARAFVFKKVKVDVQGEWVPHIRPKPWEPGPGLAVGAIPDKED